MKLSDFDDVRAAIDARSDLQENLKFITENAFWMDMKIGEYEIKSLRCFESEDRNAVMGILQNVFLRHLDSTNMELAGLGVEMDE